MAELAALTPIWKPCPNFTAGRRGQRPEAIVIHITEGTAASVDSWFRSPTSRVSAHYMVTQAGALHQYVREEDTAWHAGAIVRPTWAGLKRTAAGARLNPNTYTIGIEHEAKTASTPWSAAMYERSSLLLAELNIRWRIPLERATIIGHREIRADKTCPGSVVNFDRLIGRARDIVCGVA